MSLHPGLLIAEPVTMFNEFEVNQPQWDYMLLQPYYEDITPTPSPAPPKHTRKGKKKRVRTAYTTEQVNVLEEEFQRSNYLARPRREILSVTLGIPQAKLITWFQNRRMKQKKLLEEEVEDYMSSVEQPSAQNDVQSWSLSSMLSWDSRSTSDASSSAIQVHEQRVDELDETIQVLYELELKEKGLTQIVKGN